MKTNLKIILSFLVLALISVNTGYAQSLPEFNISTAAADAGLSIDADAPLADMYVMDISDTGWDENQAINLTAYIDGLSDYITLEVEYVDKKLNLKLNTNTPETNGWDVNDWNAHLESLLQ